MHFKTDMRYNGTKFVNQYIINTLLSRKTIQGNQFYMKGYLFQVFIVKKQEIDALLMSFPVLFYMCIPWTI